MTLWFCYTLIPGYIEFPELICSYIHSTPTPMLLSTLVVEREEMKWLRYTSSHSEFAYWSHTSEIWSDGGEESVIN